MINKKIDEISAKLETIKVLVQDNEYLSNVEKRCDEVNEKYTQALEVAQDRYDRIQKAIYYIENNSLYKEEVDYDYEENPIYVGCNDIKAREELLDILKGSEENDK